MPRITCDTLSQETGQHVIGSHEEWSAVYPEAAVSAVVHDMTENSKKEGGVSTSYVEHLKTWLHSGDDITIMYLYNGSEIDVWQYSDERD